MKDNLVHSQRRINNTLELECLKNPLPSSFGGNYPLTEAVRFIQQSEVIWNIWRSKRKAYVAACKSQGKEY